MTTNYSSRLSPTCNGCRCLQIQVDENYKNMDQSDNKHITTDNVSNSSNKKPLRKTVKVKPEEVSTPMHFEHLVHIEDLQSNANNFFATELSHDPVIRNIFNMIEKNITDTDSNATTITAPTNNDNVTELCLESNMRNQECNLENVIIYSRDMETYDNLNISAISSCISNEKQSKQERSNLKLNLESNQKASNDKKCQSIPYALARNFKEKDNRNSTKDFLMLPTHKNLVSISPSDSIEAVLLAIPVTPTSVPLQYSDSEKQESAYDAFASGNTRKLISPLYENQEAIIANSMAIDTNSFEENVIDFEDQMEIQQALKQLDDALDEQISTETFLSLNPGSGSNTEAKTSLYLSGLESKTDPLILHKQSKPSLIGVNVFGLDDGKLVAEIIAKKRSNKNYSLRKPPPTSPKPVLKKPLPIPKTSNSDEDEEHKWLLPSSSKSIPSFEKPIFNDLRENVIIMMNKRSVTQEKHRKTSNSEMLPAIIKVHNTESHTNFQPTMTDTSTVIPVAINATRKNSNQQNFEVQYLSVNHIYENLNQNDNEKYLETSFDGPVAMTLISESRNSSTMKDLSYSCDNNTSHMFHKQQKQWENPIDDRKFFIDNTSTVVSVLPYDTSNYVHNVKWRSDHVNRVNFDVSTENDQNSRPIPVSRACFKRNSHDSISDKRMIQRSISMYCPSSYNESNDGAVRSIPGIVQQHPIIMSRSSSMSIPETAKISDRKLRPKPAPRQIDCIKRTVITVDVPETENRNFGKRPIPIPRQSKLKMTLNNDLLKKNSFAVTKIQHGIVNSPESMITIAKTMNKINKEDNSRNEWMLRL
ncbi:Translation initiation factor [Dirofilaria immitis]